MKIDVLVIGAGPSGLMAAYEASSRGLSVVVVEESDQVGGQFIQQTQQLDKLPAGFNGLRGFEVVQKLEKSLNELNVKFLLESVVIGTYQNGDIGVTKDETVHRITPSRTIIATGAAESSLTFSGWTLPRVLTIGATQMLINRERVMPGKTFVIYGSSDFALELAIDLHHLGVGELNIIESNSQIQSTNTDLLKIVKELNIPCYLNTDIISASGKGKVEQVSLKDKTNEQVTEFAVEVVCIDGGRYPIIEVPSVFGCDLGYNKTLGGWIPQYNQALKTTIDSVYLAGNAAGITSRGSLMISGILAGISVAESLGAIETKVAHEKMRAHWTEIYALEQTPANNIWLERKLFMEHYSVETLDNHPNNWTFGLTKEGV